MVWYNHTQGARVHTVATFVVSGTNTNPSPRTLTTFHPNRPNYLENLLNYNDQNTMEQYPGRNNFWTYAIAAADINGMYFVFFFAILRFCAIKYGLYFHKKKQKENKTTQ